MEVYIPISKINDFLFCPKTLYLHMMFEDVSDDLFHEEPQRRGKLKHKAIDKKTYSTSSRFLIGKDVYSQEYGLMGKIDIYDKETKTLIERKTKIKKIYKGYIFQLYAQYFCMREMGYEINKLVLRSLVDNKNYEIPLPDDKETNEFQKVVQSIWNFNPEKLLKHSCPKCENSIYATLTW